MKAKTFLEFYKQKNEDYRSQIAAKSFPPDDIMALQEMNYRICVLDTIECLMLISPVTTDMEVLGNHYQMVSAYMELLVKERKFGPKMDVVQQQRRKVALSNIDSATFRLCCCTIYIRKCSQGWKETLYELYSIFT